MTTFRGIESVPVAGMSTKVGGDTTAACLHLDGGRPGTPPEIAKWRKSSYAAEPGKRVIHPGMVDDYRGKSDHPKFGKMKTESDHVEDVLRQPGTESEFSQVKEAQKDSMYHSVRREPLGKSYYRGHVLPAECAGEGFAFGRRNASSGEPNQSKNLIYTPSEPTTAEAKALYVKSHGSFDPGEQRRRGYDWPEGKDMTQHRFGAGAGSQLALNGLALGAEGCMKQPADEDDRVAGDPYTSSRVQKFKNLEDKLGRPRDLGHGLARRMPPLHKYGKSSVRGEGEWDARNCIQGEYSAEEQAPDFDLGSTQTPGFRNTLITNNGASTEGRIYGTPSVRSDIRKYDRRSVADCQNYGDDANAHALLYPSTLINLGIDDDELTKPRSKAEILDIFTTIHSGPLSEAQLGDLYDSAADAARGTVSIDSFRKITLAQSVKHFAEN